MPPASSKRVYFVILMATVIAGAQMMLLFNTTTRGWPFSPIFVYHKPGAEIHRTVEIRVWDESGEKSIIEAGLSHYQLQISLTHRVRADNLENRKLVSRYLRSVASDRSFRGVRLYEVRWNIPEAKKLDEKLVFEDSW